MKNPPEIKIELVEIEESEDDPVDLIMKESNESEDSEDYGEGIPMFDDASEIIGRAHSFISHEQETLDEKLDDIISKIDSSIEDTILENLKRCFRAIDDTFIWATRFLDQATEKKLESLQVFTMKCMKMLN